MLEKLINWHIEHVLGLSDLTRLRTNMVLREISLLTQWVQWKYSVVLFNYLYTYFLPI